MLGEILVILLIAVVAMVGAYLKSAEVRSATRTEPQREQEHDREAER
jgi:hypothetical protein